MTTLPEEAVDAAAAEVYDRASVSSTMAFEIARHAVTAALPHLCGTERAALARARAAIVQAVNDLAPLHLDAVTHDKVLGDLRMALADLPPAP